MKKNTIKITLSDNLDLVSEEVSLVAVLHRMAKDKGGMKPSVLLRRLVQENKEFRGYLAQILTGEYRQPIEAEQTKLNLEEEK